MSNLDRAKHLKCICYGMAVVTSEKLNLLLQSVNMSLVVELADDFALVVVAMFS